MARFSRSLGLPRSTISEVEYIYDSDGSIIGRAGNYLEQPSRTDGRIVAPVFYKTAPIPELPVTNLDVGAYWYQDFGLEYTRSRAGTPDFLYQAWYDWSWNHKHSVGYKLGVSDPGYPGYQGYIKDRHPMLGWYRGDNIEVLEWQCKWLLEHGVSFVIPQTASTTDPSNGGTWSTETDLNYWVYQLMQTRHVATGAMKVAFWLPGTSTSATYAPSAVNWSAASNYVVGDYVRNTAFDNRLYICIQDNGPASVGAKQPNSFPTFWEVKSADSPSLILPSTTWQDTIDFYNTYKNSIKTIKRNNKEYPLVFIFEGEVTRSGWGNTTWRDWLQAFGAGLNLVNPAWEGVAVMVRNSPEPSTSDGTVWTSVTSANQNYDTIESKRCFILRGDYPGTDSTSGASGSYQSLIDTFPTMPTTSRGYAKNRRVYSIPNSLTTCMPHPSSYSYVGHTPSKFGEYVLKAKTTINAGDGYPMIMVYNVSEWAEAGPGLQPNKQDGFDYLTALKNAIT